MQSALRDIFGHNAWANLRVIACLRDLTPVQLETTSDAVYGNPLATMHHVLDGEAGYYHFFAGSRPAAVRRDVDDPPATVQELIAWAQSLGSLWRALPLDELDADQVLERTRGDGSLMRLKTGILLAQAIHHGNVHREQVSHVLTSLGIAAPDVSLYAYAREAAA